MRYGGGKIEFGALEESEYQMEFSVFGDCVFLYVFHIFTLFQILWYVIPILPYIYIFTTYIRL